MSNKDFEDVLLKRSVPPSSSNLASRIIEAAKVKNDVPFYQIIAHEVLSMIVLPRPAYVLATFLFIGLIIGLQIQIIPEANTATQNLFSFIEIQGEDWL